MGKTAGVVLFFPFPDSFEMLLTCRPLRISNAHLLTLFQNKHPSFENAIKWENLRNGQHHKVTICRTLSFDPVGSQVEKQLMRVRVSNYFLRRETASWHKRKLTPDFQTAKVNFPAFLTETSIWWDCSKIWLTVVTEVPYFASTSVLNPFVLPKCYVLPP